MLLLKISQFNFLDVGISLALFIRMLSQIQKIDAQYKKASNILHLKI